MNTGKSTLLATGILKRKLEYGRDTDNIASHLNCGEKTWILERQHSGEKMLVGNLIHQIPFPWVNKYGEKKVRQNLFSQRKPHSIPDSGTNWKWKYTRTSKQAQCNVGLSILDCDTKFRPILNSNEMEQTSEMNKPWVWCHWTKPMQFYNAKTDKNIV